MRTLRHLTGNRIAYSVWEMPNGAVEVVIGLLRPTVGAVHLLTSDIPELDTLTGWPAVDDCWEQEDEDGNLRLVVATDWRPGFTRHSVTYAPPDENNESDVAVRDVVSRNTRQYFTSYDLRDLDSLQVGRQPEMTVERKAERRPNHRSVTFDNEESATADVTNSLNFTKVVASQADLYMLGNGTLAWAYSTSAMTYNSISLSSISLSAGPGTDVKSETWELVDPDTGSNTFVFTASGSGGDIGASCVSFYGVDQTTPKTDTDAQSGQSTAPATSLSSASGEICVNFVGFRQEAAGVLTQDAAWTDDANLLSGGGVRGHACAHIDGDTSITYTGSLSASESWGATAVAVKAAAGGPVEATTSVVADGAVATAAAKGAQGATQAVADAPVASVGEKGALAATAATADGVAATSGVKDGQAATQAVTQGSVNVTGVKGGQVSTQVAADGVVSTLSGVAAQTQVVAEGVVATTTAKHATGQTSVSANAVAASSTQKGGSAQTNVATDGATASAGQKGGQVSTQVLADSAALSTGAKQALAITQAIALAAVTVSGIPLAFDVTVNMITLTAGRLGSDLQVPAGRFGEDITIPGGLM